MDKSKKIEGDTEPAKLRPMEGSSCDRTAGQEVVRVTTARVQIFYLPALLFQIQIIEIINHLERNAVGLRGAEGGFEILGKVDGDFAGGGFDGVFIDDGEIAAGGELP